MRGLLIGLKLFAAGVLQAVGPTGPWLGGVRLPLLLAVVLHYALTHGACATTLAVAVVAGLIQDALSQTPLGLSSLVFGAAGLFVAQFRHDVFHSAALLHAWVGGLAVGGATLAQWALLSAAGTIAIPGGSALLRAVGSAALGAVVTPAVCRVSDSLDRALGAQAADRTHGGTRGGVR